MPEYQNIRLFLHVLKLILVPERLLLDFVHKLKIKIEYFSFLFDLIQIADPIFYSIQ